MLELSIRSDEQVIFTLRSLYESYGYSHYKMTKFEEYDLYVKNKDYLLSENIITFNDVGGRLMALKPDVTLSIIKNSDDNAGITKVYYNENVYRVNKGSDSFKEIMQVGLECLGNIDEYCICEVLSLAAESLKHISDESVLCVSDLDIISDCLDGEKIDGSVKAKILSCIGEKNIHELKSICNSEEISEKTVNNLCELINLHGKPQTVISKLISLFGETENIKAFNRILCGISDELSDISEVDFSVVGDTKYYNGIAFKGFVNGISKSVLSGGEYDNLMKKMKRKSKAVGFAIYLDTLEKLYDFTDDYDVDAVLLYTEGECLKKLNEAVSKLTYNGSRVLAVKEIPEKLKYRTLYEYRNGEAVLLEANA